MFLLGRDGRRRPHGALPARAEGLHLGGEQIVIGRFEFHAGHATDEEVFDQLRLQHAGQHDHQRRAGRFERFAGQPVAVPVGHHQIGDHHVVVTVGHQFHGFRPVMGGITGEAFPMQGADGQVAYQGIVVHNQGPLSQIDHRLFLLWQRASIGLSASGRSCPEEPAAAWATGVAPSAGVQHRFHAHLSRLFHRRVRPIGMSRRNRLDLRKDLEEEVHQPGLEVGASAAADDLHGLGLR